MRARNRRLTVVLAGMVVAIIAIVAWSSVFETRRFQRAQVWSEVEQSMQTDVYSSHLSLVELMAGDGRVQTTDVLDPIEDAHQRCAVLRNGGAIDGLTVDPLPALGPEGGFNQLCARLLFLRLLTTDRLGGGTAQQEGSTADETYDRLFSEATDRLDRLDALVDDVRRSEQRRITWVDSGVAAGLVVLLGGILLVSWRYGRNIADLGRRHQVVLDAAGEGIYGVGPDGGASFANPAAEMLTGRAAHQLASLHVHAALHGPDEAAGHTADQCPIPQALRGAGESVTHEDVFHRADGTRYPAEYTASPVTDDPDTSGVIVFRDITERRAMEAMKDQFVSVVSHELRTPLTSIHGSLGLLRGGVLGEMPASAQRMLEIATTNTDRLIRLINDILDIERMQSGNVTMARDTIRMDVLVEQAVASMRAMAAESEVELSVLAEPVLVRGDQDRLIQVLVNLLGNAVKFSPEGSVVTITLVRDGDRALLSVADQGLGVPADQLDSIFGRFQQVDSTDSRSRDGTGLGLAISQSIVKQHDGRIWAESELGRGSTFHVRIPAVRDRDTDPRPPVTGTTPGTPASVGTAESTVLPTGAASSRNDPDHRSNVLVIDEEPSVRRAACELLRRSGHHPVPVSSVAEAHARIKDRRPDAVLIDLAAAGSRGTLAQLRADPALADLPMVVMGLGRGETVGTTEDGAGPDPAEVEALTALLHPDPTEPTTDHRVLVIEDDDDVADVLIATLAGHGVTARRAGTARMAYQLASELNPDLIVLDLRLPDGDGAQLLRRLRLGGRLHGVPVVVYTGYDVPPGDVGELDRDDAIVITKTRVSPEDFARQVAELVGALAVPSGI